MELRFLTGALRRSRILIVLLAVAGLVLGGAYGLKSTRQWESRASLIINPPNISSLVNLNIQTDTATYISTQIGVIQSNTVLRKVAQEIPGETYVSIGKAVTVSERGTSSIVDVVAKAGSAVRAAEIANDVATIYISSAQGSINAELKQSVSSLQSQLDSLQAQINAAPKTASSANNPAVTALESQYTSVAQSLDQVRLSLGLSSNSISLFDPATPALDPLPRHTSVKIAVGLLGGLVVGVLMAVLRSIIWPRLLKVSDVEDTLGVPVTASFPSLKRPTAATNEKVERETLRASVLIDLAAARDLCKTVLVTSAEPRAGVSLVSKLMADVLRQSGYSSEIFQLDEPRSRNGGGDRANGNGIRGTRPRPTALVPSFTRSDQLAKWLSNNGSTTNLAIFDGGSLRDSPTSLGLCRAVDVVVLVVPLPSTDERKMNALLRTALGSVNAQLVVVTNDVGSGSALVPNRTAS